MPHNIRLFSDVGAKMSMFDNKAKAHKESQMINPFSDWDGSGTRRRLSRDDPNYGKPVEGSKTAERGKQAQVQMIADMVELCDVIFDCGLRSPDGRGAICFGDVFRLYSAINDKCVGLLMRGRKHNILDFEGEMLFQRRDDDKMIELLLPLNTIRHKYGMPMRAGCGEVRHDLLEELEQREKEKQPPRTRSLEQLGLPPPPLHKSKSMELARGAAKDEDVWTLGVEPQNSSGRLGRSAENLTRIAEDEGAVGGSASVEAAEGEVVFTAADDAVQGVDDNGAAESGLKADPVPSGMSNEKLGCSDGDEPANDAGVSADAVKWEVGSDDTSDKEQVTEEPNSASKQGQTNWPEVTIVVEDDSESQNNIPTENEIECDKAETVERTSSKEEIWVESDPSNVEESEPSEQAASVTENPAVQTNSEPELDFWAGAGDDERPTSDPTGRTERSTSLEILSPSLADGDDGTPADMVTVEGNSSQPGTSSGEAEESGRLGADIDVISGTEETKSDGAVSSFTSIPEQDVKTMEHLKEDQLSNDAEKAAADVRQTEKEEFSFWDVTVDEATENAPMGCKSYEDAGEATTTNQQTEERKSFSYWGDSEDALCDGSADKDGEATAQQTSEEKGFSFWNVSEEEATPESVTDGYQPKDNEDNVGSQKAKEENCVFGADSTDTELMLLNRSSSNEASLNANVNEPEPSTFSFWDEAEESKEPEGSQMLTKQSNTNFTNLSESLGSSKDTCHERLSGSDSAELPSADASGERDEVGEGSRNESQISPRPLPVPHITVSDDDETAPTR